MLKKTLRMTLLAFAVIASAMMLATLVITSAIRNAAVSIPAGVYEIQAPGGYVLRSFNGHIAVFDGDIPESPMIETTIDVAELRAVDRDKLENGIAAQNYADVLKLLEDFGS